MRPRIRFRNSTEPPLVSKFIAPAACRSAISGARDGRISKVERRKPGPVGKGPRKSMRTRLPDPLHDAVHSEAARRGMTVNDFVGEVLAHVTGVPYSHQEALKSA